MNKRMIKFFMIFDNFWKEYCSLPNKQIVWGLNRNPLPG